MFSKGSPAPETCCPPTESLHPCYSADAHHHYARMHLPVAPRCNIQCNYCTRKFDCVNESRPGVTSEVLTPTQAKAKLDRVKEQLTNLTVAGIAGPGDALANWPDCRETFQKIRADHPELMLCLSTNGLMLPEYAAEIIALGVNHVTVTVNSVDPEIGGLIYHHINYHGRQCQGAAGAAILIENQLNGIELLARRGVLVKVNIVMIKGINDRHIPEVVKKVKERGAWITNIMPLIPAPGSRFAEHPQTSAKDLNAMRDLCGVDMRQMRHCQQCRADAIGLLTEDRAREFDTAAPVPAPSSPEAVTTPLDTTYTIAVTAKSDKLVDLHFGHAAEFAIYQGDGRTFTKVETRPTEKYCLGREECDGERRRRQQIMRLLADCDAVLTLRIGHAAQKRLLKQNVLSVEYCYTIESGLQYVVEELRKLHSPHTLTKAERPAAIGRSNSEQLWKERRTAP
ncbi:MAG TPA: nitrogenase cofactor biosynthesis protein NifB [Patescibacteria group bacterium]|nr:nitrogenase cofactor biosynthesis protein NifB [Patescibacteria group bacterium]